MLSDNVELIGVAAVALLVAGTFVAECSEAERRSRECQSALASGRYYEPPNAALVDRFCDR